MAAVDPQSALNQAEVLPLEIQTEARFEALVELALNEPKEVLPLLSTIEDFYHRRSVTAAALSSWSNEEPLAALDWVLHDSWVEDHPEFREGLIQSVLLTLSSSDPDLAMTKALEQSIGENQIGSEGKLIETLSWLWTDTALKLLPRVREGPTRLHTYQSVGVPLLSRGDYELACELGLELSDSQRTRYERYITAEWVVNTSHSAVYHGIDNLTTASMKSHAAFALIRSDSAQNFLTKEQMREVAKFLTTDQREELTEELEAIGM